MKRKRFKLSENIVKKVSWKFVDGDIVLNQTRYVDIGDKSERDVEAGTSGQELNDAGNNLVK